MSHQIETSQLICKGNQLTGFYMMATLGINELSQPTFTCSKSTIETLEKRQKYVQKYNKNNGVNDVVQVYLLLNLNIFPTFL